MSTVQTPAISDDNDLVVRGGNIVFVSGVEAYSNILRAAILTLKGEIKSFTNLGIDYFSSVFTSQAKTAAWERAVRSRILDHGFVKSIESLEYSVSGGVLNYRAVVNTDSGAVEVSFSDYILKS